MTKEEMTREQYQELLSKISSCNSPNYQQERNLGYNVFDVLGVNHKEVIMCRFLADLLSPDGMHGCGTLFLNTFFEEVLREHVNNERLMSHTTVLTEYVIDDARRIDIVIRNAHFFIPIEVKIYADEQEGQCYDYYACALKYGNEAKVVYLTRFGTEPSIYSRRQKNGTGEVPQEKLLCISWMDDICGWLEKVVEKLDGQIKMLVMQYIDAISQFTDGRSVRVMDKSLEILSESVDFFEAGLQIEKTMKMVKVNLIRNVFDNFKDEINTIAEHYGLVLENEISYYSYENTKHDKFYDCYSTFPGLNYVVKNAHFKNKNLQMWFRVEVEHNLFAGFALYDINAKIEDCYSGYQVDHINKEMIDEAALFISRDIMEPEDWWLAYCYSNGKRKVRDYEDVPNFKTMNSCAIGLIDPKQRKKYVKNAVRVFEKELLQYLLQI